MFVIEAVNVRDALPQAVEYLMRYGRKESSRVNDVYASPGPVTICYINPKQHVLLNPIRDANPFFHLMEAMWMLAGRRDGGFLDHYIKDFSRRFGTDGIIVDAYGYRWRKGLLFDQLNEIVSQLRRDPTTRQCVLQMWGADEIHDLLSTAAKPCNLVVNFRVVHKTFLDMAVFNRSNDVIWGCCGTNAVHFPLLQEYVAGRAGLEMGAYWQVSTNLHLYVHHIQIMASRIKDYDGATLAHLLKDDTPYNTTVPLIADPAVFDMNLRETMDWLDDLHEGEEICDGEISNPFLHSVVLPMAQAYRAYRQGDMNEACGYMLKVMAPDWQMAGIQWLERHNVNRQQR